MVLFGGANPKNMQVAKGGCAAHAIGHWLAELAPRRRRGRQHQPDPRRRSGRGRAGMDPDPAQHRHRDDAGADATRWSPKGLHDREFLGALLHRLRAGAPYLMGESDGQPKDADWAAPITGVPADTIRALARRMAATRTMISASWSLQRADHGEQPYWARDAAGGVPRPDRAAGRRLRLRLRLGGRHRRAAAGVPRARRWRRCQPAQPRDPGGAHRRLPAASRASPTTSTAAAAPIPTSGSSIGRAAIRSTTIRTSTGCARAFRRPQTDHRARAVVDGDRAPRRHRAAGDDDARAQRYRLRAARPLRHRHAEGDRAGRRGAQRLSPSSPSWRGGSAARTPSPRAATRWAWLRHLYDAGATARAPTGGDAGFRPLLGRGLVRDSAAAPRNTCCSTSSAPIRRQHRLATPSGRIELYSEKHRRLRL